MDYIPKYIEKTKISFSKDEIDNMYVKFKERMDSRESTMASEEEIAYRVVEIARIEHKIDPDSIPGKPLEEQCKKDGYVYNFIGRHYGCDKCKTEMMGRIKAYPPYCDSTYEEWKCPKCGYGFGMSA